MGGVDPLGGHADPLGGHGPPMWALFAENVCENERIGSRRGGVRPARPLDPPMATVHTCANRIGFCRICNILHALL